jgi:hypothetical protein
LPLETYSDSAIINEIRGHVDAWRIADGIDPSEIGLFIRSPEVIGRARAASEASGVAERVAVSVMHLAKGLEFRAVAVMACDQDILPLDSRIAEAADEGELDDIYETDASSCTSPAPELATAYW